MSWKETPLDLSKRLFKEEAPSPDSHQVPSQYLNTDEHMHLQEQNILYNYDPIYQGIKTNIVSGPIYQGCKNSFTSDPITSTIELESYCKLSGPLMHPIVSTTYVPLVSPGDIQRAGQKTSRPFKAMSRVLTTQEAVQGPYDDGRFALFREVMLQQIRERNGGSLSISNPKMRRSVRACGADEEYLERRRRNNAAAKRSRDLRRRNEDELAIRAAFLEAENRRLEDELRKVLAGS